ncbi:MAG: glycosyltransferase, partial [Lutimonas sp.]
MKSKMHVLIFINKVLPVMAYGGTERVAWYLAKELALQGCEVTFLAAKGTTCTFANVVEFDSTRDINEQIPASVDIVHVHSGLSTAIEKPNLVTCHGNLSSIEHQPNIVFVSKNHAARYGSESFVYNGLDWEDYGKVDLSAPRSYFHFLGKAAWRVKNVAGAIDVVKALPGQKLMVLGGNRCNLKMGFRFTLSPKISFKGMVGGRKKIQLLQGSKGLIFPVKWDEPFGLAITESLYMGAPVFGTPYGALTELVTPEVGFLTNRASEMVQHLQNDYHYSPRVCHEYARDCFSAKVMAAGYLEKYEQILNGEVLNPTPLRVIDAGMKR